MTLLGDRYEVIRQLGRGGMGTVYEGRNVQTGRRVAIKVLAPELVNSREALQRFQREARAAAAIEHVAVLQVLDVCAEGPTPYLAMELLRGESLGAMLERTGPMDPRRLFATVALALGALAHAHRAGIVHRDLKPDNIFLATSAGTRDVVPKLLDFGISKLHEDGQLALTNTGAMIGTPLYMAPEQVTGARDVSASADLYSLGVMFYRALSGTYPIQAPNLGALIAALLQETPKPLSTLRPDLPPAISDVVMKALARNPAERWASVEEFVRAYTLALGEPALLSAAGLPEDAVVSPTVFGAPQVPPAPYTPAPYTPAPYTPAPQTPAPWPAAPLATALPSSSPPAVPPEYTRLPPAPPQPLSSSAAREYTPPPTARTFPAQIAPTPRPPRRLKALVGGVMFALVGLGALVWWVTPDAASPTDAPSQGRTAAARATPEAPVQAPTPPAQPPRAPVRPAVATRPPTVTNPVPTVAPATAPGTPNGPVAARSTPTATETPTGTGTRRGRTLRGASREGSAGLLSAPPVAPQPQVQAPPQTWRPQQTERTTPTAPPQVYHRTGELNTNEF